MDGSRGTAPWLAPDLLPEAEPGGGWGWWTGGRTWPMDLDLLRDELRQDPLRTKPPQVVLVTAPGAARALPAAEVPELREAVLGKFETILGGKVRRSAPLAALFGGLAVLGLLLGAPPGLLLLVAILFLDPASRLSEAWLDLRRLRRRPEAFLQQLGREIRFGWWLQGQARRKPWTTWILAGSWAAIYLLQVATGLDASVGAAGLVKAKVAAEPWRLLTGTMLHGSWLHIAMNAFAAVLLGTLIERVAHRHLLAPVWLLGALGGSLASWWLLPNGDSVGASGGLMAWLGFLVVLAWRRRELLPPDFFQGMARAVLAMALLGLFAWGIVDNAGHGGGLLVGALAAALIFRAPSGDLPLEAGWGLRISGLLGAAAFLALAVFTAAKVLSP
ncbi:MAG TPA: rhomboid family intramembrane serine protease [Holophagaceae bacterium]|nr:rhomboid family intramembrane serine protease [Holophagaceae bacterium]